MCQVSQDDMILVPRQDIRKLKKCLKCDNESKVVTRINEAMCITCFDEYFTHKFRLTVSKMRFDPGDIVLFPYSGSQSSVAMLSLLSQGLGPKARKKLQFKPIMLFIEGESSANKNISQEQRIENIKKIKTSVEYSEFKIYFSLLENVLEEECNFYENIDDIVFNLSSQQKLSNLVKDLKSVTSRQELTKQLKMNLMLRVASSLKLSKLALASSCTTLTIELISNIAQGKGHNIHSELSMRENRNEILIFKPLRELTSKEIGFYNYYNSNQPVILNKNDHFMLLNSTIYDLTESFIVGLQCGYPTTVPTIFRVGEKVAESKSVSEKIKDVSVCQLCKCTLVLSSDDISSKSALNNINFAKLITQNNDINDNNEIISRLKKEAQKFSNYCYACKIIIKESPFANDFDEVLKQKQTIAKKQKELIDNFLLEN